MLWKGWLSSKSGTLSLKTIISGLHIVKKTVIIQWNVKKKRIERFTIIWNQINRKKKYLILAIRKNTIKLIWRKKSHEIATKKQTTKDYGKPRQCRHKTSHYRTSKNFSSIIQGCKEDWRAFRRKLGGKTYIMKQKKWKSF